jgi:predicted nuclease of predicted toxin-antitoxin system
VHLSEEHLERLLDPAILEKARQEERLVLTFDLDFGELLATGVHALPSVILLRMRDQTPSSVTSRLLEVLSERSGELIAGAIIIVQDARYRVRRLPIRPTEGGSPAEGNP